MASVSPMKGETHPPGPRVRKRTRIACDKCSSFRVRCDGQHPCRRCQEYGHSCHYARDIKKRGRKPASQRLSTNRDVEALSPVSNCSPQSVTDDLPSPKLVQLETRHERFTTEPVNGYTPRSHPDASTTRPPSHRSKFYGAGLGRAVADDAPNDQPRRQSLKSSYPGPPSSPELGSQPPRRASQSIRRISQLINPPQHQSLGTPEPNPFRIPFAPGFGDADLSMSQSSHPGYDARGCRYKCLEPVLPLLHGLLEPEMACDLLEFYFAEPDSSLFRQASPYVLSHILRKQSLLHATNPRKTSPALLITILWACVQTADMPSLLLPGRRGFVSEELRKLLMSLVHERDRDHWHRASGGRLVKEEHYCSASRDPNFGGTQTDDQAPCPSIDDVLTLILLTIVVSGGDFKTDCYVWWHKALRLSQSMGLNLEDGRYNETSTACLNIMCDCRVRNSAEYSVQNIEAHEERRRAFWLIFSLDRHLALSFNGNLYITDDECKVYSPLPEDIWENLDTVPLEQLTNRVYGPPIVLSGTGFFEYFLPLMAILGDVIQIHHRRCHFRLGRLNDQEAVTLVERQLANMAQSIVDFSDYHHLERLDTTIPASHASSIVLTPSTAYSDDPLNQLPLPTSMSVPSASPLPSLSDAKPAHQQRKSRLAQAQLVTAYSTFILHVLHVLLHGKWDAVSMLSSSTDATISDWITSPSFVHCASHAIHASDAVSKILLCDPELTFMPYLFGIYLLHGSFILLLFADRMPQVGGPNESVERACETIIRAHEVCVVTLSTEFQRRFRKVLRSTLYSVREGNVSGHGANATNGGDMEMDRSGDGGAILNGGDGQRSGGRNVEEGKARRRVLSLYRWTSGSRGLAL